MNNEHVKTYLSAIENKIIDFTFEAPEWMDNASYADFRKRVNHAKKTALMIRAMLRRDFELDQPNPWLKKTA